MVARIPERRRRVAQGDAAARDRTAQAQATAAQEGFRSGPDARGGVTAAFIGLGANLGDPQRQVRQAFRQLDAIPHTRVVRASSLYRSAPLGYAEQPSFVNAVAQVETGLPAERLLAELQAIEAAHGRRRSLPNRRARWAWICFCSAMRPSMFQD